jgi:hypothetical protein
MIRLHEDRIALRQVDDEEPNLLLDTAENNDRLAEVRLGMAGRMRQRNEHLLPHLAARAHVVAHRRVASVEATLVAQTLEDPPCRVTLLGRRRLVGVQDLLDELDMLRELRTVHRDGALVSGWHRMLHHLRHRPAIDPEPSRRLAVAQAVPHHHAADQPIKVHAVHPPASGSF